MAREHLIQRYRNWYHKLLRLYSKSYYQRFGEGMEQTFNDLLREQAKGNKGLWSCVLWIFAETTVGIFKENLEFVLMKYKNIIRIALVVACILMIPLLSGAPWDETDYIVAGGLLFGTGLAFELVARRAGALAYRLALALALGTALLIVWINLAVGIIGSEEHPANLMFFGVIGMGMIGAGIARFQPHGMSRTLTAMAVGQALVPVIALMIWRPPFTVGVAKVLIFNLFFVLLFAGSALLFRRAMRKVEPVA